MLTGLEMVLQHPDLLDGLGRLGLLYNQASVDRSFSYAAEGLQVVFGDRLKALFGPQHGVWLTEQDNMKETGHSFHPGLGLPVYSLYSDSRKPDASMLGTVDAVLVDLQDVGTRVYTFATTVVLLMEAAAECGCTVVILDRPNPINGIDLEGNLLHPDCASFVGPYPIPMRHAMTLGELMQLYNNEFDIGCSLEVIVAAGWDRSQYFDDTGLPWVMPSPNMPTMDTAVVYPGQVILEGTCLSEGRGTTRPFEMFGAPFLDTREVLAALEPGILEGATLRPIQFRPTFHKWAGLVCNGFQLHVLDRRVFKPYRASLGLISAMLKLYPEEFQWTDPPYEYVYHRLPIDVILGDTRVRTDLEAGRSVMDMEMEWQDDIERFEKTRSLYLLY